MTSAADVLQPVIIGAGPAGIRAAQILVRAGLRPIVLDEAPRAGGQIYRQPPPGFMRSKSDLYGSEHRKADALHSTMDTLAAEMDYRPGTLVWNGDGQTLDTLREGVAQTVPYSHLILATGATDRVLPFEGWTTPGVYTLGGSQVALKYQGCAIGSRVVFMGTGPLLYLVAYQYKKAGADVVAVLDTASYGDALAGLPGMLRAPRLLALGLYYMAWLRAHGVALHKNIRPVAVDGGTRVTALRYRVRDRETVHTLDCNAVGYGLNLRSETQLASLLGCAFDFNAQDRAWLPRRDPSGRTSIPGVYVAGDGSGIAGADAAELSGERAAWTLLGDAARPVDARRVAQLDTRLSTIRRVRAALERAFPFPADWVGGLSEQTVLCRCEDITVGTVRHAARELDVGELNRLKALTRVGMGRCQGRMCSAAATEVLAQARGTLPHSVGRLRAQPPIKPLPIAIVPADTREVSL